MNGTNSVSGYRRSDGDLGRRVLSRRLELQLSVDEVARRAQIAPGYLAFLETRLPNLSAWALARLAQALETTPEHLLGVGASSAAGHGVSFGRTPSLERLDTEECLDLIRSGGVGRIAFAVPGQAEPLVLPVNFVIVDGDVVFRTTPSGVIAAHVVGPVSFQVDHLDGVMSRGWSVLVSGRARLADDPVERDGLTAVPVRPWAGPGRETYVVVTPARISGRRVRSDEAR